MLTPTLPMLYGISVIIAAIAFLFAAYLYVWVKKQQQDNKRITEVARLIRDGANTFMKREYKILAVFASVIAVLIFVLLPAPIWAEGADIMQNVAMAVSYIGGTVLSAIAGKLGFVVASLSNGRSAEAAAEMFNKKLSFSEEANKEIVIIAKATEEILLLANSAFENNDVSSAAAIEPLEQIIDELKDRLRTRHTVRLQQGVCSIELGFVWADILTDLERLSDHCSNIAGCVLETSDETLELHRSVRAFKKDNPLFESLYSEYAKKYL